MNVSFFVSVLFLGGVVALGCGPKPTPSSPVGTATESPSASGAIDLKHIRAALLSPSKLPHLMWRQQLSIRTDGKSYNLEAIVQSDGAEFQVLALGPGSMKLFLVTQDKYGVRSQAFVNRKLALSPEYLLFDIQRSLFWTPPGPCSELQIQFQFRAFSVVDQCADGRVAHRKVSDGPVGSAQAASLLHISYAPAFDFQSPPRRVSLRHPKRGYEIDIVQLESHQLP